MITRLPQPLRSRVKLAARTAVDAMLLAAALLASYELRYEGDLSYGQWLGVAAVLAPWTGVKLGALFLAGQHRRVWRATSLNDLYNVWKVNAIVGALLLGLAALVPYFPVSAGVIATDIIVASAFLSGARIAARARRIRRPKNEERRRVLIIGAGSAGETIAHELANLQHRYNAIGFLDDDPDKQGDLIGGLRVLGKVSDAAHLISSLQVEEVLIACPSANYERIGEIIGVCAKAGAAVRTLPSVAEILEGKRYFPQFREVQLAVLLPRKTRRVAPEKLAFLVRHRVLITGAGGSIGTELARHVASQGPETLIILDQCENGVFELQQELESEYDTVAQPVVADVRDKSCILRLFAELRPTLVIHAAAHKHVPLMERFPCEAIKNNIFGTLNVAEAAELCGTETFVFISTDKAVSATSVMGATKRAAEEALRVFATPRMRRVTVRFGNVLGSRGSVAPIMLRQIESGRPVTVTDEKMTRFLMGISEAAALILAAARIAPANSVMVLEMGQPVKIIDLAQNLIRLSGYIPGREVQIQVTGRRPGEKLTEELFADDERLVFSGEDGILLLKPCVLPGDIVAQVLEQLQAAAATNSIPEALQLLAQLAPGSRLQQLEALKTEETSPPEAANPAPASLAA